MNPEELIPLRELHELAGGNPNRSFDAAARCAPNRIEIVTRHRRDGQALLYVRAADVPRYLGSDHVVMRSYRGDWRFALREQRRRKTRELKDHAAKHSREARLQEHVNAVCSDINALQRQRRAERMVAETAGLTSPRGGMLERAVPGRRELGRLVRMDAAAAGLDRLSVGAKIALLRQRTELERRGRDTSEIDRRLATNGLRWQPTGGRA